MIYNPEFRRNAWIELSLHRLIAMPVILFLIFLLTLVATERNYTILAEVALSLFSIITILWGIRLSTDCVVNEFREKTWDMQRMSALSPWTLAWGKLLGANIFAWYGGVLCLAVFGFCTMNVDSGFPFLRTVLALIGFSIFAHAASMFTTLSSLRAGSVKVGSWVSLVFTILVLLIAKSLFGNLVSSNQVIHWYSFDWNASTFFLVSMWIFTAWSILGVYRLFSMELQERTTPIALFCFGLFLTIYLTGFDINTYMNSYFKNNFSYSRFSAFLIVSFYIFLSMSYLAAWRDERNAVAINRFLLYYKSRNYRRFFQETPSWLIVLLVTFIFAFLSLISDSFAHQELSFYSPISLLVLAFFAVRDIGILYFFSMGKNRKELLLLPLHISSFCTGFCRIFCMLQALKSYLVSLHLD